jgi:hypothetical protein
MKRGAVLWKEEDHPVKGFWFWSTTAIKLGREPNGANLLSSGSDEPKVAGVRTLGSFRRNDRQFNFGRFGETTLPAHVLVGSIILPLAITA